MTQKSKKARAAKKATKRKAVTKAPRPTKKVTARSTKAGATKTARTRSMKPTVARAAPVRFVPGGPTDNLEKIDHIVVLMMENRSFDHMLGYLKLEGSNPEVNGLEVGMANTHNHASFPVHHLTTTVFDHDPGHQGDAVAVQLSNNNGGFVDNYASIHPEDEPGLIMGYHNASAVPVYDHLVRNFCVCIRGSVPFPALPGRTVCIH